MAPLVLQFRASAQTLLEVARNPRHLGAEIGFFSVLHTWNQQLLLHPHAHCVGPAGGLSLDHTRWVRSPNNYFLPKQILSAVFRGKFVDGLKQAFREGQLKFRGDLKLLAQPKIFAAWLRPHYRQDWVVYLKRPFGGPEYVLHYLGRYTNRVAISNHRLVSFVDGQVTFRWRDSADHNKQKLRSLSLTLYEGALDTPGVRSALVQRGEVKTGGFQGEEKSKAYIFNKPVGFARFELPPGAAVTLRNVKGSSSNLANVGNKLFASMGLKMMLDYRHHTMTFFGDCR